MTEKLYDLNSYITECDAEVLSCEKAKKNGIEGFAVSLSQTCFFPEGGGQPADIGTITAGNESVRVLYTYEQGEEIFHLCDKPLEVGIQVHAAIDFAPRFANMQIHSGEHILSGVILKEMGLHNVGFHMGHEFNTIDLDGEITSQQARELEAKVNAIICENRPVFVSYPDKETLPTIPLRKKPEVENLRVVEVKDCAPNPDRRRRSRSGRRPGGLPETQRGRAVPEPLLAVVQTLLKTENLPFQLTDLSLGLGSLVQIAFDLAPKLLGGSLRFEQLIRQVDGSEHGGVGAAHLGIVHDLGHFVADTASYLLHVGGGFVRYQGVFLSADGDDNTVCHLRILLFCVRPALGRNTQYYSIQYSTKAAGVPQKSWEIEKVYNSLTALLP